MFGRVRDFFPKKRQLKEAGAAGQPSVGVASNPAVQPFAEASVSAGAQTQPPASAPVTGIDAAQQSAVSSAMAPLGAPTAGRGSTPLSVDTASQLTPAQRTGNAGEDAAAAFLTEKGHRILERNWRAGRDEIDLITRDGAALVFVEVRTRAATALVGGYHSIDARKKTALRRVCGAYLKTCRPRPQTYRLDVVQISMGKGGQMEIHHYAGVALFN